MQEIEKKKDELRDLNTRLNKQREKWVDQCVKIKDR